MKLLSALVLSSFFCWQLFGADHSKEFHQMISQAKKEVGEISPQELKKKIDNEERLVILDIREPEERLSGEIYCDEYYTLTRGELEFKVGNKIKDKNTLIVTYCMAGNAGALAAQTLRHLGYKNATSLKGGLKAWAKSGYPIETALGVLKLQKDK